MNFREFTNTTDQAYYVLLDQVKEDSSRLEDKEYLDHINEEVSRKSTYIIVRKGDKLYYAGNEEAAQQIFEKLPAYGDENLSDDSGYFYNELEKYVKQIDFTFRDGTPGSVFIVTKVNSLISRHLLIDMFVAIIVILIFTSLMLTQWIHKGVFEPINELNVAMRKIKEGNFDYVLENRGYAIQHTTNVMAMSMNAAHLDTPYPDVTFYNNIPSEWIESLFNLKNTINPIHRKVVPSMYQAILKETICACIRIDGQIIATGLGILDRDYIGIYAIHVKEEYRKHGYARQICTGLLKEGMKKGAQNAYLQVVEGNDNARALYRSLGFQQLYTYWFRVQPDENGNFPPEK